MLGDILAFFLQLTQNLGHLGLFVVMFLIGSFAPIPWEPFFITIGMSGFDPIIASLVGGLGSLGGAILDYFLARRIGRPLVLRYGKYFLVYRAGLEQAETWIHRWGSVATFVTRSLPYMPYKSFNLAAGVLSMPFPSYFALTLIGSVARCLFLIIVGKAIPVERYVLTMGVLTFTVVGSLIITVLLVRIVRKNFTQ